MVTPCAGYAEADRLHGAARGRLGAAAHAEREAFTTLRALVARVGPAHPDTEAALEKWRTARGLKAELAAQVQAADERWEARLRQWAREDAARYLRPEVRHG